MVLPGCALRDACLAMGGQAFSARGMSADVAAAFSELALTWRPHSNNASRGDS